MNARLAWLAPAATAVLVVILAGAAAGCGALGSATFTESAMSLANTGFPFTRAASTSLIPPPDVVNMPST